MNHILVQLSLLYPWFFCVYVPTQSYPWLDSSLGHTHAINASTTVGTELTVTLMLDFLSLSSCRRPSVMAVTACFVAQEKWKLAALTTRCPAKLQNKQTHHIIQVCIVMQYLHDSIWQPSKVNWFSSAFTVYTP